MEGKSTKIKSRHAMLHALAHVTFLHHGFDHREIPRRLSCPPQAGRVQQTGHPSCPEGGIYFGICHGKRVSDTIVCRYLIFTLDQPNLKPPVTTTEQALAYKAELQKIDPNVEYLMTLYLSPDLTPDEVKKAKKAGIVGSYMLMSHSCVFLHGAAS